MQTVASKIVLAELGSSDVSLDVGNVLEAIIHYEIKEIGQHVLACTVTYVASSGVPSPNAKTPAPLQQTFSKYYKFTASNPLSVKTKVHLPKSTTANFSLLEREKVFLEVHIQNLTNDGLWFERMEFLPVDGLSVQDAGALVQAKEKTSASLSFQRLHPKDIRQYIYILTPDEPSLFPVTHEPGTIVPLGRLDLSWRSTFGEPGRLLTSMLSRKIAQIPTPSIPNVISSVQRLNSPKPLPPIKGASRPSSPFPERAKNTGTDVNTVVSNIADPLNTNSSKDLDVQLLVTLPPNGQAVLSKSFDVTLIVAVRTTATKAERCNHTLQMILQHRPSTTLGETMAPNATLQPESPMHSELTQVENKASFTERRILLPSIGRNQHPWFQERRGVGFVGASVQLLPRMQLERIPEDGDGGRYLYSGQVNVSLRFVGHERGLHPIYGFYLFEVGDRNEETNREEEGATSATLLKEWIVIGEVWIQ